jgi:hypothetical protein
MTKQYPDSRVSYGEEVLHKLYLLFSSMCSDQARLAVF